MRQELVGVPHERVHIWLRVDDHLLKVKRLDGASELLLEVVTLLQDRSAGWAASHPCTHRALTLVRLRQLGQ